MLIRVNPDKLVSKRRLYEFVCVDALPPSQQVYSHVETISCHPGLNRVTAVSLELVAL